MGFDEWCKSVGYDGTSNGWARIAWDAATKRAADIVREYGRGADGYENDVARVCETLVKEIEG